MRSLFIIGCAALALAACDRFNPSSQDTTDTTITIGKNQELKAKGVDVLIGPATAHQGSNTVELALLVLDAPPVIQKPAYGVSCLAFDAKGGFSGSETAQLPPRYAGGPMGLNATRSLKGGRVDCKLISLP